MPVSDKLIIQQGVAARLRSYPLRDKTLKQNQELQKGDYVKKTEGLRAFANFPDHELERLAHKGRTDRDSPNYWADLDNHQDPETRSRAIKRLVNSSDGREYRVSRGKSSSIIIKNNPLHRDK